MKRREKLCRSLLSRCSPCIVGAGNRHNERGSFPLKYCSHKLLWKIPTTENVKLRSEINMLLAGWEVRIGKNCDRGLESLR